LYTFIWLKKKRRLWRCIERNIWFRLLFSQRWSSKTSSSCENRCFWIIIHGTVQSSSRLFFLIKHSWKAHPTAWLNRSPYIINTLVNSYTTVIQNASSFKITDSFRATKPWHIHRRVKPSRHIYENPFSWLLSGAQNETFSIVWSTINP